MIIKLVQHCLIICLTFTLGSLTAQSESDNILSTVNLVNEAINTKNAELIDSAFIKTSALFYGVKDEIALEPYSENTHTANGLAYFIKYWKENEINVTQLFDDIDILENRQGMAIVKTNYTAHRDGNPTHWGKEIYSLILTKNGWKIVSCIFSINTE
ncbi:MAG: hypothetical protein RLO81_18160 [Fulvivirga sp.]|uniref:hypothetical protein n=1 Tax=Fulvivirga sp. TaxID=1931237 RepID=UPI0032EC1884